VQQRNTYTLIRNEETLKSFIEFLPELKENESYFLILIARKKWFPESDIPSAVKLKRESVNSKEKIIQVLKQWEVSSDCYTSFSKPIHQNNLGVYIGYNPKNQYKACFDLIEKSLEAIKSSRKNINIKSMANDVIQSANGSKNFIDVDVDIKEGEDYLEIVKHIKKCIGGDENNEYLTFVKTSGGFHCLIRLEKLKEDNDIGNWYQRIKRHDFKSELNIMTHDLMPLVGCNQGLFVPYIFNI
jgi:hypothetical protein